MVEQILNPIPRPIPLMTVLRYLTRLEVVMSSLVGVIRKEIWFHPFLKAVVGMWISMQIGHRIVCLLKVLMAV